MKDLPKTIGRRSFLGLSVPAAALLSQQAQIETGTRTGATSVRLAVPEFPSESAGTTDLAATFNETLWEDLDFSGIIDLVSRRFYPRGRFGQPNDIDLQEWSSTTVDAQLIAFGSASLNRRDQFVIEARFWDLRTRFEDRELIPGQRYTGEMTEGSVRLIAHKFADRIIEAVGGGIRGVAQTKLAFESDRVGGVGEKEIFVMDYDGHDQYQLTTLRSLALTPNWHPDGERIAFTSYAQNKPDVAIISRLDRRGYSFQEFEGTTTTPAWSPDGTRIAFSSSARQVRGQPDMEIYVSDARGGTLRRLTNSRGVDISPAWNPRTGNQIAFVSQRSGQGQIYIIDAEGGNLRQIVGGDGSMSDPAWSPDGQTVAFNWQKRGRNFDIYLHDLATGRNVQLTADARDNEQPTWSPDGRHLAFQSTRGGSKQIYSMLADGTKLRRLTSEGNNMNPAWSSYIED